MSASMDDSASLVVVESSALSTVLRQVGLGWQYRYARLRLRDAIVQGEAQRAARPPRQYQRAMVLKPKARHC